MPYVQLDAGTVINIFDESQIPLAETFLPDDDPAIVEFLKPKGLAPEDYEASIQEIVDDTAREKQFRDGVTLASYANSTVDLWASQALAFIAWRDNVWQYSYSELSKVLAGDRAQPTIADFLLELPEMVWPA